MRALCLLLGLAVACGADHTEKNRPPVDRAAARARIAPLLPADALFVVYLDSFDAAAQQMLGIARKGNYAGPAPRIGELGLPDLDPYAPIGAAWSFRRGMPFVTFVGTRAADGAEPRNWARSHEEGALVAHSSDPEYAPGGCALWENVPDGTIAFAGHAQLLVRNFEPLVQAFFGQSREMLESLAGIVPLLPHLAPAVDFAESALRSTQDFHGTAGFVDSLFRVDLEFVVTPESELGKRPDHDFRPLLARIPADAGMIAAVRADWGRIVQDFFDPQAARALEGFAEATAWSGDITAAGFEGYAVTRSERPAELTAAILEFARARGDAATQPVKADAARADWTLLHVTPKEGEGTFREPWTDGVFLQVGGETPLFVARVCNTPELGRATPRAPSGEWVDALAGDRAVVMLLQLDGRRVARGIRAHSGGEAPPFFRDVPADGPPIPMHVSLLRDGLRYSVSLRMHADWGNFR